jgi:hypothetical protein
MAGLLEEAKANPNTPLVELNRFAEVDLSLIIQSYEEAMMESETEEGVIAANYGECEKQKGFLAMFFSINSNYSQSSSETSNDGSAELSLNALGENPFGDCFPCDGRITLGIDNLPHPAILNPFAGLLDAIEAFIQQLKNILDPTNFYSDICQLIDAFRIVCPQDLLVLLALLRFLLRHYLLLSFQLNIDWISILGMILLPILMLIHALLQMAVNIGLGPLRCLIDLLTFLSQLSVSLEETLLAAKNAASTSLQSFQDVGQDVAGLFTDQEDEKQTEDTEEPVSAPEEKPSIPKPPTGGYQAFQDFIGKLTAVDSMLVAMTDIKITLEEFLAKFTRALEVIIKLLSAGMLLKMQFAAAITDILRLIGFLIALIKALMDKSVCDDPTVPLSPSDVEAVIKVMNDSRTLAAADTTTTTTSQTTPLISSTVGLDFDTATGDLIIQDKITDQSKRVPTCISKASSDDRAKIEEWIAELESSSI